MFGHRDGIYFLLEIFKYPILYDINNVLEIKYMYSNIIECRLKQQNQGYKKV